MAISRALWAAVLSACALYGAADQGVRRGRIRADSNLVLINASVTDAEGHFVSGLGRRNFRLYDERTEQRILDLWQDDAPVSMGIVFDASGSMEKALPAAMHALREFAAAANPQDEFAAVVVRNSPQWTLEFTRDPRELVDRLAPEAARGPTALIDSIYLAAQRMKSANHARKALLVISDGMDNCSRYSTKELRKFLQEADVTVYSVGLFRAFPDDLAEEGRDLLQEIALLTGGRYFQADGPKNIEQAVSHLDVRSEYVIGFSPQGVAADGRYHHVNLKLLPPNGAAKLRASWRRGYYAPDYEPAALPRQ